MSKNLGKNMFPKNRKEFRILLDLKKIVFTLSERYFLNHNYEFNFKKSDITIENYHDIRLLNSLLFMIHKSVALPEKRGTRKK